jgi:hypothetical protein
MDSISSSVGTAGVCGTSTGVCPWMSMGLGDGGPLLMDVISHLLSGTGRGQNLIDRERHMPQAPLTTTTPPTLQGRACAKRA